MKKKMSVPLFAIAAILMLTLPNIVFAPPPPPAPQTPIYRYVDTAAISTNGWLPIPSPSPAIENLQIYIDTVAAYDLYIYNTLTPGVFWLDFAAAAWTDVGVRMDLAGTFVQAVASASVYAFAMGTITAPFNPQNFAVNFLVGFILDITIDGTSFEIFFAATATARWVGGVFMGIVSGTVGSFAEFIRFEIRWLKADLLMCPDIARRWLLEVKINAALDSMNRAINYLEMGDEWHAWAYMRRARLKLMEFESLIIQYFRFGRMPGDVAYKMYKVSNHLIWHLYVATTLHP